VETIARHSDVIMAVLYSINANYGRDIPTVKAAGIRKH
jgi:hypothetical protein